MRVQRPNGEGFADLKYLSEEPDRHGNVRVYFRRNGRRIRIEAELGTDAFFAAYSKLFNGEAVPAREVFAKAKPGSFRALVEEYYGDKESFGKLTEGTKAIRRRMLDGICLELVDPDAGDDATIGSLPFALVDRRAIKKLRDRRSDKTEAANARLKAIRQVFTYAVDEEYLDASPADVVAYLESDNPDGWHTWTIEEIIEFAQRHPIGTKARLALSLLLFTGQRKSDVATFGRQQVRDGVLKFVQIKNRARKPVHMEVPILPELQAVIDATPHSNNLTYLVTQFGHPFTRNGFGNWFRRRCDEAGLPQCSAHGLRKAGAVIAAEAGATEHQLMAIFGWKTMKQAALYTKKANQKAMAGKAMHLLVPEQMGSRLSHLFNVIGDGATKTDKIVSKIKG